MVLFKRRRQIETISIFPYDHSIVVIVFKIYWNPIACNMLSLHMENILQRLLLKVQLLCAIKSNFI